jgi:transmembrane sensor
MSGLEEEAEALDKRAIEMRAAEFVERRDSVGWTDVDEQHFAQWLEESSAHRVAFLRLNASWQRTERLAALRAPEFHASVAAPEARRFRFLPVAAAFGLVLASGGFFLAAYLSAPRYDTYATTIGGHETLKLHDGTRIELNTNTLVRIAQTPSGRLVKLERGEAYFDVRHDEKRPFIVATDSGRIVDIGTKFSADVEDGKLKLSLLEGRIRFETKDASGHPRHVQLAPGQTLVGDAGSITLSRKAPRELTSDLAWRSGMLVFHETSLADAAAQFNRYNETKIVIADPRASRETINGKLPTNDLEEFERMARNIFGLRAEKRGNELVLTR